ncbi:MAG TPA: M56 family metallopeptidase [Verrucomicrobiae bacterium]|jgi:beta-lactamase regulating signal transducer with metallopeptidase domain/tetratricopeptide (TPR) repeat protein
MNFPNLTFWSNLLGTVGIEVCAVVALGIAAQTAFRRAYWKRAVWQITVLCLVLIFASEWTGAGRGAVLSLFGKKRVVQLIAPPTVSPGAEIFTAKEIPTISAPLPAPKKPLWWPGLIWLAGTVIVLGRMATAQGLLLLLRLRREKIVDSPLQDRVVRVARILRVRRKVCLLRLPESISPMAFGILRPTIGLPPGFETGFSAAEQDAILAHELAHLAALDPLWFRLSDFASAILWWHPLAWWARRSLHGASELAADEATALVPDGPGSLAHCLVSLGKKMTLSRGWGWTGINGGFRSKLGKRVERLTHMSAGHGNPLAGRIDKLARVATIILIVPSIVLLFGAFQTAQGEKENAWHNSWNSSPGVLLAMAAAEETDNSEDNATIASLVQDAKHLYEMGKLEEAEGILVHVLRNAPSNKIASSYLAIIKEAKSKDMQSKLLMIWAEHEVTTRADYLNYSNILWNLSKIPKDQLGAELTTAYTNLGDVELQNRSIHLSYAKEKMAAIKSQYGDEHPKYKASLQEFQQAQDDYDNKVKAIFSGIQARVDGLSNFLQNITQNEDEIRTRYKQQTEIPKPDSSNQTKQQTPIATRVMDAKLLFEMGKLEASKAILKQVLQDDPTNKNAPYYLNLIKQAETMDRARKREASAKSAILDDEQDNETIPKPIITNGVVYTSRGKQAILSKLDHIRLNEVQYDLPLTEVLDRLGVESRKRDPEKVGINFLFNPHMDAVPRSFLGYDTTGNAPAGAIAIVAPHPPVDVSSVNIKISPALIDVRLSDVLNAITMVADQPIQYKVEDYGVVFSPKPAEAVLLYSKTYHFDPNIFIKNLMAASGTNSGNPSSDIDKAGEEKLGDDGVRRADDGHDSFGGPSGVASSVGLNFVTRTNNAVQLDTMVRSYFTAAGVDLTDPGKSVFLNERLGLLLVRATAEDLQRIDAAIGALNELPAKAVSKPAKSDALMTKAFQLNPILFNEKLLGAVGSVPGSDTEGANDTEQFKQALLTYFAKAGAEITAPEEIVIYDGSLRVLVVRATSEKLKIIEQAIGPLNKLPSQVTVEGAFVDLSQTDARELGFENFLQTKEPNFTSVLSPSQYETAIRNIKQNMHEEIVFMPKVTTLSGRQMHAASQDLRDNVPVGPAYDMIPTVLENGYSIKTVLIPTYTEFLQNDSPGKFVPSAEATSGDKTGAPVVSASPVPHFRTRQVISTRDIRDGQTVVVGQLVSDKHSGSKRLQLYFVTPRIIDPAGNVVNSDKELSEKP